MRPLFLGAFLRNSCPEVAPPTSNSARNGSLKITREHSGQPAGSPVEAYTEKKQPHDSIARRELA